MTNPEPTPPLAPRTGHLPVWPLWAALGTCLVLGLSKELWYDEAYTMLCYVATGPLYSLTHYQVPNNHVLFSALLAALHLPHVEPLYRLVPVAAAVAAVLVMLRTVARAAPAVPRRSRAVVVLAVLLAFPSFLSFATQLRGYALSILLLAGCLLALVAAWHGAGRWPTPLYAVAGALAVATIPTNLAPLAALAVTDLALWRERRSGVPGLVRVALRQVPVALGALVYLPTWRNVLVNAGRGWAWHSPFDWTVRLALALALPALLLPLLWLLSRPAQPRRPGDVALLLPVRLVLASVLVIGALAAAGAHLFPRSLAGFLPIAVVIVALLGLRLGAGNPRHLWLAAVLLAVVGQVYWQAGTRWLWRDGRPALPRQVLPPYFESSDFDPAEAAAAAIAAGGDRCLVLVDNRDRHSDEMSVWYYAVLADRQASFVLGPRNLPPPRFSIEGLPTLIVSRDAQGRDGLLAFLGRPDAGVRAVKDTGHFKVWLLVP